MDPVDQVVRLREFEADNPNWSIWPERDGLFVNWHARHAVTCEELEDYNELREILDELERRARA